MVQYPSAREDMKFFGICARTRDSI